MTIVGSINMAATVTSTPAPTSAPSTERTLAKRPEERAAARLVAFAAGTETDAVRTTEPALTIRSIAELSTRASVAITLLMAFWLAAS